MLIVAVFIKIVSDELKASGEFDEVSGYQIYKKCHFLMLLVTCWSPAGHLVLLESVWIKLTSSNFLPLFEGKS